jgi:hypothetical protein
VNKEDIIEELKQGVCEVTFTKVNGETRTMPCTLNEGLLPTLRYQDPDSLKKVREINEKVVVAWCTDKREWRSFRWASVTEIKRV